MYIQKIRVSGFKSIYDQLEIDFSSVRGFWKITGEVGAGKTTIGEAIIFGLFGSVNGKNNSDLISWGLKHGLVELWCSSKGNNLYIRREINMYGQSPIYTEVNGEELIFTNKRDAQAQLENEYYDTTRTMVELLCVISFNNFKSISTMNARDTKIFLDKILGFQILTQYSDICKGLRSENAQKITEIQHDIDKLTSQIVKLKELSNADTIEGDMHGVSECILQIESSIKHCKDQINDLVKKYNNTLLQKNKDLSEIVTLGKNKAKEIKLIESGKCPTCGAAIDQSQLDIKRSEKEVLTQSYISKQKEIDELKKNHETEHNQLCADIKDKEDQLRSQRALLIRLEEQAKRLSINFSEIKSLEETQLNLNKSLDEYLREDQDWQTLYNCLSVGIRQQILNSFIPILNKNILDYSQALQQPYIIQFDNDFNCTIRMSGFGDRVIPVGSLSTGQLKTVDMVIILGVLKSAISTSNINIMFLDELFSNLDSDLRNKMCNVLKLSMNPQHTLFIISHQDINDDYFDGIIKTKLESFGDSFQKKSNISIISIYRNNTDEISQ